MLLMSVKSKQAIIINILEQCVVYLFIYLLLLSLLLALLFSIYLQSWGSHRKKQHNNLRPFENLEEEKI